MDDAVVDLSRSLEASHDVPPSREKVKAIEDMILQAEQIDLQTQHYLAGAVYVRTIFIPAGTVLTGAANSKDHVNIVVGDITVSTDKGMRRLTGWNVLPTSAGIKRVGYAHADTYWATCAHTELQEVEAIEDELTDESERLQTRQGLLTHNPLHRLEK